MAHSIFLSTRLKKNLPFGPRRFWILLFAFAGFFFLPLAMLCAADLQSLFTTVELDVAPEIAVQADAPVLYVNDPGASSDFDLSIDFTVQANTRNVDMFVEATDFYFHADPSSSDVPPIALVESAGIEIDAQGAVALTGSVAAYTASGDAIDGYPSRKTETLTFQSSDAYAFSHPVAVTVTWHMEPMKPAGQYAAKVRLTCIAIPAEIS